MSSKKALMHSGWACRSFPDMVCVSRAPGSLPMPELASSVAALAIEDGCPSPNLAAAATRVSSAASVTSGAPLSLPDCRGFGQNQHPFTGWPCSIRGPAGGGRKNVPLSDVFTPPPLRVDRVGPTSSSPHWHPPLTCRALAMYCARAHEGGGGGGGVQRSAHRRPCTNRTAHKLQSDIEYQHHIIMSVYNQRAGGWGGGLWSSQVCAGCNSWPWSTRAGQQCLPQSPGEPQRRPLGGMLGSFLHKLRRLLGLLRTAQPGPGRRSSRTTCSC